MYVNLRVHVTIYETTIFTQTKFFSSADYLLHLPNLITWMNEILNQIWITHLFSYFQGTFLEAAATSPFLLSQV